MIHLDTSFIILALVRGSHQDLKLREWLRADEMRCISTIAWTEFLCGPVKIHHVELARRVISEHLPFEDEDASFAAQLFNQSGRRRGSLADCMIAATALRYRAALATANLSDFQRFEQTGLTLISTAG